MSEQTSTNPTAPVTSAVEAPVTTSAEPVTTEQVVEAPVTEPVATEQVPNDLHKRFQALSKREKLMQDKFAKQQQAIAEREQQLNAKMQELRHLEELKERLNQFENPVEPETTDQRVERLEKMLKEKEQRERDLQEKYQREQEQLQITQAIDSYQQSIAMVATSNPDTYELFTSNKEQAMELALEVAKQYYKETETILQPEDAVKYVEEYLEEQYKTQYQRLLSFKKLKANNPKQELPVTEKQTKPVLNNNTASGSSIVPTPREPWNPDKSKAKAAELLKWKD